MVDLGNIPHDALMAWTFYIVLGIFILMIIILIVIIARTRKPEEKPAYHPKRFQESEKKPNKRKPKQKKQKSWPPGE